MQPWETLDRAETHEGELVLQRRGSEFVIALGGRIIMSSRANHSERQLAELVCGGLCAVRDGAVVVAGLGLGLTLRAGLDLLPRTARVTVVELTPKVVAWCRGPMAVVSGSSLSDERVDVVVGDVFDVVAGLRGACHGIALDLWQGPLEHGDRVFTAARLVACRMALRRGGLLGVWSEQSVGGFERRLLAAGFAEARKHVARRGFRHVIYVARAP